MTFTVSGRIVGAIHGPWANVVSWQVVFLRAGGTDTDICCGGVLLSNEHILTAAHCKPFLSLNGKDKAFIGAKSLSESDRIHILSQRYFVHEEYETFKSERYGQMVIFDFMILFLQNQSQSIMKMFLLSILFNFIQIGWM